MEDLTLRTTAELVERVRGEARHNQYDDALIAELQQRFAYIRCPDEDVALIRDLNATVLMAHFGWTKLPPQIIQIPGAKYPPAPASYRRQDEAALARFAAERKRVEGTTPPHSDKPAPVLAAVTSLPKSLKYDVFISYAHQDRDRFVGPLVQALPANGFTIWYAESFLTLGDAFSRSIDIGLLKSRFAVLVLSSYYFKNRWTKEEYSAIHPRATRGDIVILPIWHGVTESDVSAFSPMLAGKQAIESSKGLDVVVAAIRDKIRHV